jgi:glycosyltransferase involved in cell wall biosynthesis
VRIAVIVKALMVVRDEAEILRENLLYHLALGLDEIYVLDHCSTDGTVDLLRDFAGHPRVRVFVERRPKFDQEAYVNFLLDRALAGAGADWIFALDADEFLGLSKPLRRFLSDLEARDIRYGTIKWLNALPGGVPGAGSEKRQLEWYYEPWLERPWQEEGHFRKAFCRTHKDMSVVVGGHYFRREANPDFFGAANWNPAIIPLDQARIYHLEQRLSPKALLEKWARLSTHIVEPGYDADAPWNEKVLRMKQYLSLYGDDLAAVAADWFDKRRTLWGSEISPSRLVRDSTLAPWLSPIRRSPAAER